MILATLPATARFIRWTAVICIVILGLLAAWVQHLLPPADFFAPLCFSVLLTALTLFLWFLDSLVWPVSLSAIVFLELLWVWAVRRQPVFGWWLVLYMALTVLAALVRKKRSGQLVRLNQGLEDLEEALTEKRHGIDSGRRDVEALEKKTARYQRLQSIAESLSNMTDLQAIAQLAVDRAFELVGKSESCSLLLLDESKQTLSLVASRKRDPSLTLRAKHGDPFDQHILKTQKPLLVNDIRRDFRFAAAAQERAIAAMIGCPIHLTGRPEGVLRLDSAQPAVYSQDDLRLLDILLDLVGAAVTNARLFAQVQQLAVTDSLTGLASRRPFMERFGREILRAVRQRETVAVLMLDVDYFKRYNDAFGHLAGDAVLRSIAEILRKQLPAESLIARYGGEEFAVVIPRISVAQAVVHANAVRLLVEQDAGRARTGNRKTEPPPVTLSAGVSGFPADGEAELELIRIADQRLYQAKSQGRNRVCSA